MKKVVLAVIAVVILLGAGAAFFLMRGRDLSAYERFRVPTRLEMPTQKMLVVEATGNPEVEGAKAFGALFKAYFALADVPKGPSMPAPRARWPKPLASPMAEWLGLYAMPVPETITALPAGGSHDGLTAKLVTWEYGEVAQILHIGPYDKEQPTVERLHAFIKEQGYEIAGAHEEEYLRGPGMFGKGDPEKYYTLLRYPIRKAATRPTPCRS